MIYFPLDPVSAAIGDGLAGAYAADFDAAEPRKGSSRDAWQVCQSSNPVCKIHFQERAVLVN